MILTRCYWLTDCCIWCNSWCWSRRAFRSCHCRRAPVGWIDSSVVLENFALSLSHCCYCLVARLGCTGQSYWISISLSYWSYGHCFYRYSVLDGAGILCSCRARWERQCPTVVLSYWSCSATPISWLYLSLPRGNSNMHWHSWIFVNHVCDSSVNCLELVVVRRLFCCRNAWMGLLRLSSHWLLSLAFPRTVHVH